MRDYVTVRQMETWLLFIILQVPLAQVLAQGNGDDFCLSKPCQNGGTCVNGQTEYTCTCSPCYTGILCENQKVNECASNPCQSGGTCNDLCESYNCTCPINVGGTNCDAACDKIGSTSPSGLYYLDDLVTLTCTHKYYLQPGDKIYWSMKDDGSDPYATTATATFVMNATLAGSHYCFVEQHGCTSMSSATMLAYEVGPASRTDAAEPLTGSFDTVCIMIVSLVFVILL